MEAVKSLLPRHAGHDMSGMDMGQSNASSAMMMSTHFTTTVGASNLWFSSWTPTTAAATFGACLGLFFLGILSRFLSAVKSCAEVAWADSLRQQHRRSTRTPETRIPSSTLEEEKDERSPEALDAILATVPAGPQSTAVREPRPFSPPFTLAIDFPRAILFGLQSFVAYLLMLAVMSYSAAFFVAILVGLVVGELCFGRFIVLLGGGALGGHHGAEHL
ncbi:copper transporter family protein [Sporobolomyces koalae]|uniref:copper transporter family protein n=1 Tax=Sporobolomyces koalae TaxID=500713 RepID=UPI00317293F6